MRTRTLIILASLLMPISIRAEDKSTKEVKILHPEVAMYSIGRFEEVSTTRLFVLSDDRSGYTLRTRSGDVIAKDVYYVKTFGGSFGAISVHVIRDRFIVYPETVKDSEVPDTLFHEMHAVTRVYDLQNQKLLTSSEKYRYDHDVPLQYDLEKILRAALLTDKAQKGGVNHPSAAPESKSEGNAKSKPESEVRSQ